MRDVIYEQSAETQWQKVSLLLEFGEWLYTHSFPKAEAQHQIQGAVDYLLHMNTSPTDEAGTPHWLIFTMAGCFNSNSFIQTSSPDSFGWNIFNQMEFD